MNDTQRFTLFRKDLLRWFAENRRPLPWRADYTPYRTWIAEVMMQQTQMDRGVQYFLRWMERFPDVAAVAAAPEEDLLKAWEGLGYYRRARNIQAAARVIMERHGGNFPTSYADILALPGVGPYTAGAIASTAYNEEVPCVDGNVERVLSRVFDIDTPVKEEPAKSRIRELAQALIPKGEARNFNQGLMELGALVCRKKPECERCPLVGLCESRHLGIQNERPVPGKKAAVTQIEVVCGVLLHEGKVFIQRRNEKDVWGGLWEFPGGCVEPGETPSRANGWRKSASRSPSCARWTSSATTTRPTGSPCAVTSSGWRASPKDAPCPRSWPRPQPASGSRRRTSRPSPCPRRTANLPTTVAFLTTRPQASSFCPRREARGRQPWREPRNISGVSPHAQDCLLD